MKACVLEAINKLVCKEVPTPEPKTDEVLLKIRACGICSSDYDRVYKTGTYHFPTIPGHEFCGEIVAVGNGVKKELIGQRAVVFPLLPCRKCLSCKEEHFAQCANYNYFGSRCDGAFAEYIAVPLWNCQFFSNSLDFDVAALCEPASVAFHAVRLGNISKGQTVCIVGTGTIAILCGIWAQKKGARVIFIGRNTRKKEFLEQIGFHECLLDVDGLDDALKQITNGQGVDVALECVGSERALEKSILSLKQRGTLILIGNPDGNKSINKNIYWKLLRSEITVKGSWNSDYSSQQNDWNSVLRELESNPRQFSYLITHKFKLEQCNEAFEIMTNKTIFSIKGMFIND